MSTESLGEALTRILGETNRPNISFTKKVYFRRKAMNLPGYFVAEGELGSVKLNKKDLSLLYFEGEIYILLSTSEAGSLQSLFRPMRGYTISSQLNIDTLINNDGYIIYNEIPPHFNFKNEGSGPEAYLEVVVGKILIFQNDIEYYSYIAFKSHPEVVINTIFNEDRNILNRIAGFLATVDGI